MPSEVPASMRGLVLQVSMHDIEESMSKRADSPSVMGGGMVEKCEYRYDRSKWSLTYHLDLNVVMLRHFPLLQ